MITGTTIASVPAVIGNLASLQSLCALPQDLTERPGSRSTMRSLVFAQMVEQQPACRLYPNMDCESV